MQDENITKRIFSARLSVLMQERGLTQLEVASGTGATQSAISNYLRGQRLPGAAELVALSNFFKVSSDYLISRNAGESAGRAKRVSEEAPEAAPSRQARLEKAQADLEQWIQRALIAEKELRELKAVLRKLGLPQPSEKEKES